MPKVKITNTFAKRVKRPTQKKKEVYSDIDEIGLILEVRATGTKSFYYRYTELSKTYQKKLSSADSITASEARKLVQSIKRDKERSEPIKINSTLYPLKEAITLQQFWDTHYLPYIKGSKRSYKTQVSFFKIYILPYFGTTPMDQITNYNASKHFIELTTKHNLAKSTSNKFVRFLSYAFKKAIEWKIEHLKANPIIGIKEHKVDSKMENYLSKEQIQTLLKVADETSNSINIAAMIRFYLLTGARRGEVLNAKWKDIDLDNMIWTIPLNKSNKIRKVPISKSLGELIVKLPKNTSEYLFPSPITNIAMNDIYKQWNKVRIKANLPHIRLHDLRHTTASILVNKGVSIYQVQHILGHSSVEMTMRYAHLSNQALNDAVSVLDGVVK